MKKSDLIIVRGAGDLATGTIHRLKKSGFHLLVLETDHPAAIRRQVALSEAVYSGSTCVENVEAVRIESTGQLHQAWNEEKVPVLVDPEGESIRLLKPKVVVDAILAKKNLGTTKDMAPLTIGLGPGQGSAYPNTGIPGIIGGYGAERVIHAPAAGILKNRSKIGDIVEAGQMLAVIEGEAGTIEVPATINGLLRGLIRDNYPVTKGFKIADIDPRKEELANCFTISDKARCIAGSVLEVVCGALE